jgi:hypothetical protein
MTTSQRWSDGAASIRVLVPSQILRTSQSLWNKPRNESQTKVLTTAQNGRTTLNRGQQGELNVLVMDKIFTKLAQLGQKQPDERLFTSTPEVIENAKAFIQNAAYELSEMHQSLIQPSILADVTEEVVFEWWSGKRKLSVYIGEKAIRYIKVWGIDINQEMEDGELSTGSKFSDLWAWLYNP